MYRFLRSKAMFMIYLTVFLTLVMPFSSAEDKVCCEQTLDGSTCIYTSINQCDTSVRSENMAAPCEQTSYCSVGCCISESGVCYKSTSQSTCNAVSGEWLPNSLCQNTACYQGCCKLTDTDCSLSTEVQCEEDFTTLYPEKEILFYTLTTQEPEQECQSLCDEKAYGCCIDYDVCTYTTQDQCSVAGLQFDNDTTAGFFKDSFCSSLAQCEECIPHFETKCAGPDEEDVYWFDSCGNQEELEEDCEFDTKENFCTTDEEGQAYCKSVNCAITYDADNVPYDGVARKNGESWCQYDGKVGGGADLVGSRHYRHICINGEEMVEPCRDFREEYCLYSLMENLTKGDYYYGECVNNDWEDCATICNSAADATTKETMEEAMVEDKQCCESSERDCVWVGEEAGRCIPLITPGFAHYGSSESEEAVGSSRSSGIGTCKVGDNSCRVYWSKKNLFDDWDLAGNSHCIEESQELADSSNSYCRSLGDCGSHYNFIGQVTNEGYTCTTDDGDCVGSKHGDSYDAEKPNPGTWAEWRDVGEGLFLGDINPDSPDISDTTQKAFGISAATWTIASVILSLIPNLLPSCFAFPVGTLICAGMALIGILLTLLATTADQDSLDIKIKCNPWQAPYGGDRCEECNQPFKTCSEYRCRSLGLTCRLVNEGTPEAQCIDAYPDDSNSPTIQPDYDSISEGYYYKDVSTAEFSITPEIELYKRLSFGIITSEEAQCKIHNNHTNSYNEMPSTYLGGSSYFRTHHNTTLAVLDPRKEYTYYIRCIDYAGNYNSKEYTISYKASEGPDLTPPLIEFTSPANNAAVANIENETILTLYLNEPSNCRYDLEDKDYNNLNNNFTCLTHSTDYDQYFECQSLIDLTSETNLNVRCQDLQNNTNQESFKLHFVQTPPLEIKSIEPSGILYNQNDAVLTISTTGGANAGLAQCYFSTRFNYKADMTLLKQTNSTIHIQPLQNLNQGQHNLNILCEDSVGNKASTKTNFTLDIDTTPPKLLMLYQDASNVHLTFDELTICEYSNIPLKIGEGFQSGLSEHHTIPLGKEFYYIACEDQYQNTIPLIIVYPYKERIYHELNEEEIEQSMRNQSILYI